MIRSVKDKGKYKLIIEFDTTEERDSMIESLSDAISSEIKKQAGCKQ